MVRLVELPVLWDVYNPVKKKGINRLGKWPTGKIEISGAILIHRCANTRFWPITLSNYSIVFVQYLYLAKRVKAETSSSMDSDRTFYIFES